MFELLNVPTYGSSGHVLSDALAANSEALPTVTDAGRRDLPDEDRILERRELQRSGMTRWVGAQSVVFASRSAGFICATKSADGRVTSC